LKETESTVFWNWIPHSGTVKKKAREQDRRVFINLPAGFSMNLEFFVRSLKKGFVLDFEGMTMTSRQGDSR
jgi:hypothetical protein